MARRRSSSFPSTSSSSHRLREKSKDFSPENEPKIVTLVPPQPLPAYSLAKLQRLEATNAPRSFSFACGGWLKMYLFGVGKAIQQCKLEENTSFIGSSAGALTATGVSLGCDFDKVRDYIVNEVVPKAHATFAAAFNAREYMKDTLIHHGDLCQVETATYKAKFIDNWTSPLPPLTVVYSSLSKLASRRITKFEDGKHLMYSLIASCCATPIAGFPFRLNNEWVFDGGLLDFQPIYDANTITVSPFYCTNADIKPSRYVPMWWALYPPSQRDVAWLFDLGYEDGLNWIVRSGLLGDKAKSVKVPTTAAKYDGEWTTSVGRIMGYRSMESYVLDLMFVFLLVCVWKPLAFLFLYLELLSRVVIFACKAALYAVAAKFVISSVTIALGTLSLASITLETTFMFIGGIMTSMICSLLLLFFCGGIQEAASRARADWNQCVSCLRSVASLSLFLRSVPLVGNSIRIKRHQYLLQHSLVYRVIFHLV